MFKLTVICIVFGICIVIDEFLTHALSDCQYYVQSARQKSLCQVKFL